MRIHAALVWFSVAALLAGCAGLPPDTTVTWTDFDEAQQSWPTSTSGMMQLVDGFPVYGFGQLPPEPYDVLGYIYAASVVSKENPAPADEGEVVKLARAKGGQAALCTKRSVPAAAAHLRQTDYLVIKFTHDTLADALARIDIYLALTAGCTNGYSAPDGNGGTIRYSAAEVAATRKQLEEARQAILARPDFPRPAAALPTNAPPVQP